MKKDKLIHKVIVRGDPKYKDLSLRDKVKLMDEFLNPTGPKALFVDFDFSHTIRRINRRLYSKPGHMETALDLVKPYLKPITLDHEQEANKIIGRITEAQYVSLVDVAGQYLSTKSINPLVVRDLDEASGKLDFEKVRDIVKQYRLHTDKTWMGIGKVSAKAKISDKDAIERFLDGRYQTFSAETDSDMYICSECLQDWYVEGICDCGFPGPSAFMMTGHMVGGGSSVVTHPADDMSIVTNLSFTDSSLLDPTILDRVKFTLDDVMFTDSIQQLTVVDEKEINMRDFLRKFILDESMSDEDKVAFYNAVFEDDEIKSIKVNIDDVEKSIVDLKLSDEDRKSLPNAVFAGKEHNFPIVDEAHALIAKLLIDRAKSILQSDECEECNVEWSQEELNETDWEVLNEELETELDADAVDAKLSTETRNKLPTKSFCGPSKSFPVPDCAHVTAARRLIGRAKVSDSTKAKILACVSRKAKSMGCDSTDSISRVTNNVVRKYKAFGCEGAEIDSVVDVIDVSLTLDKISSFFTKEKLALFDKDSFSKSILEPVVAAAKELSIDFISDSNSLLDKLTATETELANVTALNDDFKKQLESLEKSSKEKQTNLDIADARHDAMRIEYKELFVDHTEIYKELDEKNDVIQELTGKLLPILKVLSPLFDINDKTIKNIYSLLDSLDLSSLESKLNDGLTHRQVSSIESPIVQTAELPKPNTYTLTGFERQQIDKYKEIVSKQGVSVATQWFDSKMKKYCSKDFHPSKYME